MTTRIRCTISNNPDGVDASKNVQILWFEQEEGKKSSFILECGEGCQVEKPAHVVLDCCNSDNKSVPFVVGGFELVSNARNIEAYVLEAGEPVNKETYLTTCRGIKVGETDDWHKCLLVCPGGPRSLQRIHLKLLSLRPPKNTIIANLRSIKLKGRLPPSDQVKATEETNNKPAAPLQAPKTQSALPSQSREGPDIAAAMAGISMLVRTTEDRMMRDTQSCLAKLDGSMGQKLHLVERSFGEALSSQVKTMQQLESVLRQQNLLIQSQAQAIETLNQQQSKLLDKISSLQDQLEEQKQQSSLYHEKQQESMTTMLSVMQKHQESLLGAIATECKRDEPNHTSKASESSTEPSGDEQQKKEDEGETQEVQNEVREQSQTSGTVDDALIEDEQKEDDPPGLEDESNLINLTRSLDDAAIPTSAEGGNGSDLFGGKVLQQGQPQDLLSADESLSLDQKHPVVKEEDLLNLFDQVDENASG